MGFLDDDVPPLNVFEKFIRAVARTVDGPVTWFRTSVVEPNRQDYPWYHKTYRRVPTIDQCYEDDPICQFEANQQFKRDKIVDSEILNILRERFEDCVSWEAPDHKVRCAPLWEEYEAASGHWFTKYGDLGYPGTAEHALLKQKHRMIWERRHGPVGSGMKKPEE